MADADLAIGDRQTLIKQRCNKMKPKTGPIQKDTVYPKASFMGRIGWGEFAMRSARRSGLKVIRAGKSVFIRGEDFIDWLESQNSTTPTTADASSH